MPESEVTTDQRSLVSDVLDQLGRTMEAEVAVGRLAKLLVPALGDWCVITLVDDDESRAGRRRLRDIGWWHVDPDQRDLVRDYAATRIGALTDSSMLMHAIDSGELVHVPAGAVVALDQVLKPGRARDLVTALAPASLTVAPLIVRGRTLGALTLFSGQDRAALTPEELPGFAEIASSAALALDNSRLYRRQRDVAASFQRSLLTDPLQPDDLEIAVRYQPAAEAARVGGDWYDAFTQPNGSTVVVIGDVVGHDIEAAALMAQLRSMLRTVAVVTDASPAQILRQVDAAAHTLSLPVIATVVVARIEQTQEEHQRGETRVRWANAGHPPPMVIDDAGAVHTLDGHDLLLGVNPASQRVDRELVVERGSTLVLYTDGLIERRTRSLATGLDELCAALGRHRGLGLEELCDTLLAELPGGPGEDDISMVGVRLHPQD